MSNKEPMLRTLQLAQKLGAIQKIPFQRQNLNKGANNEDDKFSYLLILDFESTCWQRRPGASNHNPPPPEIIEFPVVLLDLKTGEIVSEFHEYVMPTENSKLSQFCTELTGITQEMVDNGIPIGTCLHLFNRWIKNLIDEYQLILDKNQGPGNMITCCTWSDWDLNLCLENECRRKQLVKPASLCTWIDIRAVYRRFYQRRPQGLNGALRDLGLEFSGREHSGIEDARNTAKLVYKMIQDGCVLKQESSATEEVDLNDQIGIQAPSKPQKPRGVFTVSPPQRKKKFKGPGIYAKENLNNVRIQLPD
eukprot:TRINITY_DN7877_c0_g1_i18.p1 TRINITY_DN7877_c0_g1~~TRINITY_DN7877_c0_g1_i18.p1  ORF type:complete len:306 (-),score=30.36 TRINITY_DN7877_c0_g1_i18:151-1068(-)